LIRRLTQRMQRYAEHAEKTAPNISAKIDIDSVVVSAH
jgi:hypothetical protein